MFSVVHTVVFNDRTLLKCMYICALMLSYMYMLARAGHTTCVSVHSCMYAAVLAVHSCLHVHIVCSMQHFFPTTTAICFVLCIFVVPLMLLLHTKY